MDCRFRESGGYVWMVGHKSMGNGMVSSLPKSVQYSRLPGNRIHPNHCLYLHRGLFLFSDGI